MYFAKKKKEENVIKNTSYLSQPETIQAHHMRHTIQPMDATTVVAKCYADMAEIYYILAPVVLVLLFLILYFFFGANKYFVWFGSMGGGFKTCTPTFADQYHAQVHHRGDDIDYNQICEQHGQNTEI